MDLKPECRATAIGSFPHKNAEEPLVLIVDHLKDIPMWPQLPDRVFIEGMCPQYSEGLPAVTIDVAGGHINVDTGPDLPTHLEKFYEQYLTEELEPFAVSAEYASGLYAYLERFSGAPGLTAAKGHITGPITWGLTVSDQDGRAAYYDDMLKDGIVKGLARKAQWQALQLKRVNDHVIIFIDEPYMQSIGSATVALREDDVLESLNEVIAGLHQGEAYAGIHCCGNTDWALLTRTETDIINFDAWNYAESLSLYPREIGDFLEKGGVLAWGIVPNTEIIETLDAGAVITALRRAMALLAKKGISETLLLERALITPSCGCGTLTEAQCAKMIALAAQASDILRGKN